MTPESHVCFIPITSSFPFLMCTNYTHLFVIRLSTNTTPGFHTLIRKYCPPVAYWALSSLFFLFAILTLFVFWFSLLVFLFVLVAGCLDCLVFNSCLSSSFITRPYPSVMFTWIILFSLTANLFNNPALLLAQRGSNQVC